MESRENPDQTGHAKTKDWYHHYCHYTWQTDLLGLGIDKDKSEGQSEGPSKGQG
jgi:hypothetical protein